MIKATYRKIPVEVLVEYKAGDVKYAAVRAIDGQPFARRDKLLAKTEYATVKFSELNDIEMDQYSLPTKTNLLIMSLAYQDKKQWHAGESIWLWRNGNKGAFLKEMDGYFVTLNLTGYQQYLIVFHLNPKTWKWEISRNLGAKYYQWVEECKGRMP